jgi:signal transduction histidine kinase
LSIGPAAHLEPLSVSRTFVRAIQATGFTCLVGAAALALAMQLAWPVLIVWPAMLSLVPMIGALYLLSRRRTRFFSLAYLMVGGASVYWYCLTIAAEVDLTGGAALLTVALPKVALVLVGGSGIGAVAGIRWCTAGYLVAEAAALVAGLGSGRAFSFDKITGAAWLITALLIILVHTGNRVTTRTLWLLDRAARDDVVSGMRHRIELKAAALLHDTVLSHLAAISGSAGSALNPKLADQIERDLAVLGSEEWLTDAAPHTSIDEDSDWRSSDLYQAVRQARALGLDVDTTGDSTVLARLDAAQSSALGLAVRQCLVNVIEHSGTMDAEVAVHGSASEVLAMVVDTGCGFTEQASGSDRLGLKNSVRGRIEAIGGTVQIWSTPGRGTSVIIRVPLASGSSADRSRVTEEVT